MGTKKSIFNKHALIAILDYLSSCLHQNVLLNKRQYLTGTSTIDKNSTEHKHNFSIFVTRPDIEAPRMNIAVSVEFHLNIPSDCTLADLEGEKVYNSTALASGYWFMAAYEFMVQQDFDNRAWLAPYIYDQNGDLVWSGGPSFNGYNVVDFKVSRIGEDNMLTGIFTRGNGFVVMNSSYEMRKMIHPEPGTNVNLHGFTTVDNGTRSLGMTTRIIPHSFGHDGPDAGKTNECEVFYPGFEERDTKSWELLFAWSSQNHIHFNESFLEHNCSETLDYLHANSIDKFPDGDYLLSGRHTNALYKISAKDGSVVWRFGGKRSDFEFTDQHFSGQHDAQVHFQNETHTIISILDNAFGLAEPITSNDQSRGMIIVLHTNSMKAEVKNVYNHPQAGYATGRGNFQLLQNGNAFLSWWTNSLISEHAADGTLLMQASLLPDLKSYRSYKYNWVGRPADPPDVVAQVVRHGPKQQPRTEVYVSWNGATEIATWELWKTDARGNNKEKLAAVARAGFETMMAHEGIVPFVIVKGLDRHGNRLGESLTIESTGAENSKTKLQAFPAWASDSYSKQLDMFLRASAVALCAAVYFALRLVWRTRYSRSFGNNQEDRKVV